MPTKSMLLLIGALSVIVPAAEAQEAGREAFLSNACNRCHAIESHGIDATVKSKRMRGPDLSEVGKSRDAAWLVRYIEREVQANDKDHPVAWKGTPEELQAMASWLAALEKRD